MSPLATEAGEDSPYPGLRPFQAADSRYFFGCSEQVEQIVTRLRASRFVAVIGGSGSGKSSLVLAGAIPMLRSQAIKEAGDFWVPVIMTPGTNLSDEQSPMRRLARKFAAQLKGGDKPERVAHCLELLRQPQGLKTLIENLGRDLANTDRVDLSRPGVRVNFLLLIDQFEELFHESNQTDAMRAECADFVRLAVEHFRGHESNLCLALTMRSEHLSDCPRFPGLADAINGTFFLVKRMDGGNLRDAIVEPAQRFLEQRAFQLRAARIEAITQGYEPQQQLELPERIEFDQDVLDQLLSDSESVLHQLDHADHLPLLQHLLFWTWRAAVARHAPTGVPERISMEDLQAAVRPADATPNWDLPAKYTYLEICLENRCEAIYAQHGERHWQWEAIFRRLAFKEPNTGSYTQQRADMASLGIYLGGAGSKALTDSLAPWRHPHDYLHWDTDSQSIKVAHETLIRRWSRLRDWIDKEDVLFQNYVRLLEHCGRWVDMKRPPDKGLISGDTLRFFEQSGLEERLGEAAGATRFERLLLRQRDGLRLSEYQADAANFLRRSREHHDAQEKTASRRRDALFWAGSIAIGLIGVVVVGMYIRDVEQVLAKAERPTHRGYAAASETAAAFRPQFEDRNDAQLPLRNALMAAYYFSEASRLKGDAVKSIGVHYLFGQRMDSLENAATLGEVRAIDVLRSVLVGSAMQPSDVGNPITPPSDPQNPVTRQPSGARNAVTPQPSGARNTVTPQPSGARNAVTPQPSGARNAVTPQPSGARNAVTPPVRGPQKCSAAQQNVNAREELSNAVFYPQSVVGSKAHGLVILPGRDDDVSVYEAKAEINEGGKCQFRTERLLTSTPPGSALGLATDLSALVLLVERRYVLYSLLWNQPGGGPKLRFSASINQLSNDPGLVRKGDETHVSLPAKSELIYSDVFVGNAWARIFAGEPAPHAGDAPAGEPMVPLKPSDGQKVCGQLAAGLTVKPEEMWEHRSGDQEVFCLFWQQREDPTGVVVVATLFRTTAAEAGSTGNKAIPLLAPLALGEMPKGVVLDAAAGWLHFEARDGRWTIYPWSLKAWTRLALSVYAPDRVDKKLENCPNRADDACMEGQQHRRPYNLIFAGADPKLPDNADLRSKLQAWIEPTVPR